MFAFDIIEFYNTCGILQAMFMYIIEKTCQNTLFFYLIEV